MCFSFCFAWNIPLRCNEIGWIIRHARRTHASGIFTIISLFLVCQRLLSEAFEIMIQFCTEITNKKCVKEIQFIVTHQVNP